MIHCVVHMCPTMSRLERDMWYNHNTEEVMGNWGPIFADLFCGSMCGAGPTVFSVWAYCIANGFPSKGKVRLNPVGLGAMIGTTADDVKEAIAFLCQEDPESASQECGGARLLHLSGHEYEIVNWSFYQSLVSAERRRARDRARKERERKKKTPSGANKSLGCPHVSEKVPHEMRRDEMKGDDTSHAHPSNGRAADDRFEEFWKLYPRKVSKKRARTAWKNMTKKKRQAAIDAILEHTIVWDKQGRDMTMIPHPTTWLNQERWEDDLSAELKRAPRGAADANLTEEQQRTQDEFAAAAERMKKRRRDDVRSEKE
jgi:hypothetical protein